MGRSFRRGFFTGILGPIAFLAALAVIVYRATGKVPFPVKGEAPEELVITLVPLEEVGSHWRVWRQELSPAVARVRALFVDVRDTFLSNA